MALKEMWLEDVSWSNPPKDREKFRAVLNTEIKEWGISGLAEQLRVSQECLCSVGS